MLQKLEPAEGRGHPALTLSKLAEGWEVGGASRLIYWAFVHRGNTGERHFLTVLLELVCKKAFPALRKSGDCYQF